ncbi:MAG: TolB family protein [Longimicrobiales bacterium]
MLALVTAIGCSGGEPPQPAVNDGSADIAWPDTITRARPFDASPAEPRLRNLRKITHGGQNAEAYFSADGRQLIFQATWPGVSDCDQMFVMNVDGSNLHRVSTGEGKTTCGYFFPAGDRILFSSTHLNSAACPAQPDYSRGYVWPVDEYDIFFARPDGSDLVRITETPGYDAEATLSPDGSTIVFTSTRDGDLDIYTMNADGSDVRRLTDEPGYDGGAFFSPDGSRIIYRAHHPTDSAELADYRALLADGLVRPTVLSIYLMNADGSGKRRVTNEAGASFAPFFHPSGEKIIFSSNMHDPEGRDFDLYLVNLDGTGLERVTQHPEFDGFPMFSPDGRLLVFASNRGGSVSGETNVFIADWVEDPVSQNSR